MNEIVTSERCHTPHKERVSLIDRLAKNLIFRLLTRLRYGQILILEGEERTVFGADRNLSVEVTVHHPALYRRLLFGGSIGSGEAYIHGLWDVDDLTRLMRIMVLNIALLDRMEQGFAWLLRPYHLFSHLFRRNSKQGSKKNILSHYDLGNEMYRSFLDPTMMYSSAIYSSTADTLDKAAINKLDIICRKLALQPGDTIIEIGTGWGGFAIHAAREYGCRVTTTTLSDAQYKEARKRVDEAGLHDRITLLQKDYRDLTGQYDKLVSIEMIEAVGDRFLPGFFEKCGKLLKKDGVMLLQAITIRDQVYKKYVRSVDFIQRYIFPGGCVVANSRMLNLITEKTDMVVRHLDDYGFDYARTLRDWRKRFHRSFPSLKQYGYDETFRRLWDFYLCYCEGGFEERAISVVHVVATRPAHRSTTGQ